MGGKNVDEFVIYGGDYQEPKNLVSIGDVLINYLKRRGNDEILVNYYQFFFVNF
jgi:hypothetical protein